MTPARPTPERTAFARRCAAWWRTQADYWRGVDARIEQSCRENAAYWQRRGDL